MRNILGKKKEEPAEQQEEETEEDEEDLPVPAPSSKKPESKKQTIPEVKLVIVNNIPKAEAFEFEGKIMSTNEMLVWMGNKLLDIEDKIQK